MIVTSEIHMAASRCMMPTIISGALKNLSVSRNPSSMQDLYIYKNRETITGHFLIYLPCGTADQDLTDTHLKKPVWYREI